MNVVCLNTTTINVVSATYGYNWNNQKAKLKCDDWKNKYIRDLDDMACRNPNSSDVVADKCNGLLQCTISATNKVLGDPCEGVTKYFELYYNCNQDGSDVDSGSSYENNTNSDEIQVDIDDGVEDNNDDKNDSDDDNDNGDYHNNDDEDGNCLSAVAVVAFAAGIPFGAVVPISIIVILACILAHRIKR
ncbi:D-galactoside-specific lectin [Holothuria leucospilota]|uniref:D-galactoside-specific lectin n=1 Tax=Holothuria leucospilota TaxID=206669 RepID=A0A9Q1H5K1_HOLLE|nr:D-galactoside-specific lectin [Holothuria leucospilota]